MLKNILPTLLISTIFILFITPLAMAQDPSPFEITINPESDIATTGQQFVYTIVVTNTSNAPVREAVVSVGVPDWAGFVSAHTMAVHWFIIKPLYGETGGRAIWYHSEAMQPNDVVTFELTVEVLDEVNVDVLTTDAFVLIGEENRYETGVGPILEISIATPTPGPSLQEAGATKMADIYATQTAVIDARIVAQTNKEATKISAQATTKAQPTPIPTETVEAVAQAVTTSETLTETEPTNGILSNCLSGFMMLGVLGMVLAYRNKQNS